MANPQSREIILQAAGAVLAREGSSRLTIDAVAQEASLSKGGVLHHFPTKNALLAELLRRISAEFQGEMEGERGDGSSWAEAMLKLVMLGEETDCAVESAMLMSLKGNEELTAIINEDLARWGAQMESENTPAPMRSLVLLVMLGRWLSVTVGLNVCPTEKSRQDVCEWLCQQVTARQPSAPTNAGD